MSKYIIFSGIDGSGKTSIINGVSTELRLKGNSVSYIWMRYNRFLVTFLHAIAKMTGLSKKEDTVMGKVWLHYFYKSQLFCWFYIYCTYIDNWFARKKPLRLKTDYVICDRWINDIVVDLASETRQPYLIQGKWYDRFQRLLPKENKQFIILRDKDAVLNCRTENTFNPAFERRYVLYAELAKRTNIIKVDNNETIEACVMRVINQI